MTKRWHENWTPGEITRYRKRVVDVEAFRYGSENEPQWWLDLIEKKIVEIDGAGKVTIHTLTGDARVWGGEWVIRGPQTIHGKEDIYPCYHDQFIELFEPTPQYAKTLT